MSVTVLGKPACVQCNGTYRHFDKNIKAHGILEGYAKVDMSQELEALDFARSLGHGQAPVVIVTEEPVVAGDYASAVVLDHWSGYNPGKVDEHSKPVPEEVA